MMLSLFVTLGIFLLIAARNPSANRSLIAFTASSSLAHGAVMVVVAVYMASERAGLLVAVAALVVIGVALIVLTPAKHSGDRLSWQRISESGVLKRPSKRLASNDRWLRQGDVPAFLFV